MIKTKRAGKGTLRSYYNQHLRGPGGLMCPCCGAVPGAKQIIRRKNKQDMKTKTREANSE